MREIKWVNMTKYEREWGVGGGGGGGEKVGS